MPNARFSVLIPTRERPATFRHTLATVASQPGDDLEIVVADNCSGAETKAIVDALASPRVRYVRSDEVLPMAVNWERGLSLCTGEYVTVLGDDDGFVPSTLELARKAIDLTQAKLLAWSPHTYWWPDTIVYWNRNRLYVTFGNGALWRASRQVLEAFYEGSMGFGALPMIYTAFVHRDIVNEARRRHGGFFVPPDTPPDISSGILGLHLSEKFVHSSRPLSVRGNSGKSNGTAQWARSLGAKQREIYYREERVGMEGIVHQALVPSPNLNILIASVKLKCKEAYFPADARLTVDPGQVVHEIIDNLNHDPDAYEENLADARALAEKLGMHLDPSQIPDKKEHRKFAAWGPLKHNDKGIASLGVHGDLAGISNIAEAARLVDAVLPPKETYLTQS